MDPGPADGGGPSRLDDGRRSAREWGGGVTVDGEDPQRGDDWVAAHQGDRVGWGREEAGTQRGGGGGPPGGGERRGGAGGAERSRGGWRGGGRDDVKELKEF